MKKSSFLTTVFSFIPGAGHMYLGYMKRGVSLMVLFCAAIAMTTFIDLFGFVIPVIWFYSFFDAYNLKKLCDANLFNQEFKLQDEWLVLPKGDGMALHGKESFVIGSILVLLGAIGIYQNCLRRLLYWAVREIPVLASLVNNIPTILLCAALIVLGIWMMRRKKENGEDGQQ